LLLLPFVAVLIAFVPLIFTLIGSGWALVSIVFASAGIIIGRVLGGPEDADRTVLSLASASRHPWVAVALIAANVDESQQKLAMAAVIVYVLINASVAAVYLAWLAKNSDQRHGTMKHHKLA
jgi:BASS family bile acid:Na+ symporter